MEPWQEIVTCMVNSLILPTRMNHIEVSVGNVIKESNSDESDKEIVDKTESVGCLGLEAHHRDDAFGFGQCLQSSLGWWLQRLGLFRVCQAR
jgi:hypothetical protein